MLHILPISSCPLNCCRICVPLGYCGLVCSSWLSWSCVPLACCGIVFFGIRQMQQGELKNTRPWWVGKTQDHDEQEEHKTMEIKKNIKITMIKRNTGPKWLGGTYQSTITKRNTLNHNNQIQHQDHSDKKKQECSGRRCSNWSVPSLETHLT